MTAQAPVAIDTRTGNQTFRRDSHHGAPTNTTSQILQQSIAGAARAPTGEVHIRGQHAEYTYYVDGVPVPPGISGSLNELFDRRCRQLRSISRRRLGRRVRRPERGHRQRARRRFRPAASTASEALGHSAARSARTAQGLSLQQSASANTGLGLLRTGAQFSNMRLEPVADGSAPVEAINFHNDGTDYLRFGKLQYAPRVDVFRSR